LIQHRNLLPRHADPPVRKHAKSVRDLSEQL